MILLFDQNISYRVVKNLQTVFKDCIHISQCKLTNARDSQIWDYAKLQGFCVVTHDDDFDDIYALNGFPPKIIKLKTGNLSNQQTIEILTRNKDIIYDFLTNVDEGFLTFTACRKNPTPNHSDRTAVLSFISQFLNNRSRVHSELTRVVIVRTRVLSK